MKILHFLSLGLLVTHCAFGQGPFNNALAQAPIEFKASLEPLVPPLPQFIFAGRASFYLDGNIFRGSGDFYMTSYSEFARIVNSSGDIVAETRDIIDLAPETYLRANWSGFSISDTQVNQLKNNQWSVLMGNDAYPDGVIRGQIILIPEPSTYMLSALGALVLWIAHRRTQLKNLPK